MDAETKERVRYQLRRYHKLYAYGGNIAIGLSRREFVRKMIREDAARASWVRAQADQDKLTEIIMDRQLDVSRAIYQTFSGSR